MNRPLVYPTLLTLFLGLNHVPLTMAAGGPHESAQPRVVATVIALGPRGMATIRAADGTLYTLLKGTTWHVGDTVECEHRDSAGEPPWHALDCRKIS